MPKMPLTIMVLNLLTGLHLKNPVILIMPKILIKPKLLVIPKILTVRILTSTILELLRTKKMGNPKDSKLA